MTTVQLIKDCRRAIDTPSTGGKISLMIPGKAYGNTKKFPCSNIRGEIVCEYDNECLVAFDAAKLLEFILKQLPTYTLAPKDGDAE